MWTHASEARTLEIENEKRLLVKADTDIEDGRSRLRNQISLLSSLQESGHNTHDAERLVQILHGTLIEWERHRELIRERISYLESQADL